MRKKGAPFNLLLLLIIFSFTGPAFSTSDPKYPTQQAAHEGDITLLKDLLIKGQSQYMRDSALHFAIKGGHIEAAELLISHGAKFALMKAAEEGNIKLVRHFLNKGQDKNNCDSALHGAVRKGHKKIVELLLTEGADVIP